MKEEIWKPIKNYEDLYFVSNRGRVKSSHRSKKVLKQHNDSGGYPQVILYKDGGRKTHRVHRLIAEAFIPNPDKKPYINHINSVKHDNSISNLEWCTNSENQIHAYVESGRVNKNRKLSKEQVFKILSSKKSLAACAEEFSVTERTIKHVRDGTRYKNYYKEFY